MRIERTASRLLEAFKDKSNKSPKAGLTHSDTEADLEALAKIVQRRETFLDAMEIWPDGAHRANKVGTIYLLSPLPLHSHDTWEAIHPRENTKH